MTTLKEKNQLRAKVGGYFEKHPEAKDGVIKAWYAYHAPHFREMPEAPLHNFTNSQRESKCVWCGRSREMVRHDDLDAKCQKRPNDIPSIESVVREEEEHAMALAERAQKDVPKLLAKLGMSGKTLAVLHHTHGHDPETVATVTAVPQQMLADYHAEMEMEKARSRSAQKRELIEVQS